MLGYTDWCKLTRVSYKDGEGYVDIDPNHSGKYSFVNGYCKVYSFNTDTLEFNNVYRRIYNLYSHLPTLEHKKTALCG